MKWRIPIQIYRNIKQKLQGIERFPPSNHGRVLLLLGVMLFWLCISFIRLTDLMLLENPRAKNEFLEKEDWVEGKIPPLRGRILDRNGTPLAKSVRQVTLQWDVPPDRTTALRQLQKLKANSPAPISVNPQGVVQNLGTELALNTSPDPIDVKKLIPFCKDHPRVRLTSRFVRKYYPDNNIQNILGNVKRKKGITVGVSGIEKRHDTLLRGCPGVYRVKLNDKGEWIEDTWKKITELRAGYDVYIPLDVKRAELIKRK